ncbi:hypothetical protein TNCV_224141 [Trichonephila clavipes]|nr:hypothetical protein TNCV_224141 [Trichonephila clavipes]
MYQWKAELLGNYLDLNEEDLPYTYTSKLRSGHGRLCNPVIQMCSKTDRDPEKPLLCLKYLTSTNKILTEKNPPNIEKLAFRQYIPLNADLKGGYGSLIVMVKNLWSRV